MLRRMKISYRKLEVANFHSWVAKNFTTPDVLQVVMSAQLLQKPLQVFFCSDEVWNIKNLALFWLEW